MSSLNIPSISAALQALSSVTHEWTPEDFNLSFDAADSIALCTILNAAPALIAEIERLRADWDDEQEAQIRRDEVIERQVSKFLGFKVAGPCDAVVKLQDALTELRQQLDTAKAAGAAEWHEAEAAECSQMNWKDEAKKHLEIAAELRKQASK